MLRESWAVVFKLLPLIVSSAGATIRRTRRLPKALRQGAPKTQWCSSESDERTLKKRDWTWSE